MRNTFRRPCGWPRVAAILAALLVSGIFPPGELQAQILGKIEGRVQDGSGFPLVGALVAVQSAETAIRQRLVLTNHSGVFSVPDLVAGKYLVKVTKSRFLPSVATSVDLTQGAEVALTLNLQSAIDLVRRGISRGRLEDVMWVLRSSPSGRPILRLTEDTAGVQGGGDSQVLSPTDASGYVQVYSTSSSDTAGTATDSVGSQFAVTVPLVADSQVTFSGKYTEAEDQPRGFGATYEFPTTERHRATLAVDLRQGALLNGEMGGAQAREIKVEYGERFQWSKDLAFDYGTSVGRADGIEGYNFVRPEFGVTWAPTSRTSVRAVFSRQTPRNNTDEIRGREYFERSVYIPPELERYVHTEFGVGRTVSEVFQVSAVVFRDQVGTQGFLVDADDGQRAIMFLDAADGASNGVRFYVDGTFRNFEAGVGYTFLQGLGFDPNVISPEDLWENTEQRTFHVVTARFRTDIELTQTVVTAVYRWTSGFSLAPIDPYQPFAEFNDPTLSLTIAQDLPSLKILPAKVQAVVDARNLFEPSFGSRRTVHAGYPRLLKGGIHFKF